jgi:hypothetical protein
MSLFPLNMRQALTDQMTERGQLYEGDITPRKYDPSVTDEECEQRLIREGRERRRKAAEGKGAA